MRFLSRFGLAALVSFFISLLIASASYLLGFWLGRNGDNLWWLIRASVPFALLLGLASSVLPERQGKRAAWVMLAVLIGATLPVFYTIVVARYYFAVIPAFLILMLSCWVPSGVSAMLVTARVKPLPLVIGIAALCVAATALPEPVFNAFTRNQQLTVALVAPSVPSTENLEASPDALGFHNADEIRAAKKDVLDQIRALGYGESFRVLSITRAGKGKKSLAIIVLRAPITKRVDLPEPYGSTVVYVQQSENWEKKPPQTPVLSRGITMLPPAATDDRLGYFEIPDAQGASLVGIISIHSPESSARASTPQ